MVIWYRNSILASLVSIIGCVIVVFGVTDLFQGDARELTVVTDIVMIVVGIAVAALGKIISDHKAEKKRAKARQAAMANRQAAQAQPQARPVQAAQPVQQPVQRPVQQPVYAPQPAAPAPKARVGVAFTMAAILFILSPVVAAWANMMYTTSSLLVTSALVHNYGDLFHLTEYALCLFLAVACFRGIAIKNVSWLHIVGLLGVLICKIGMLANVLSFVVREHYSLRGTREVAFFELAGCLLIFLFAIAALPKNRSRFGGMVKALWFLPWVVLLVGNCFFMHHTGAIHHLSIQLGNGFFRLQPVFTDSLSLLCLSFAVCFTGFGFRRICKEQPQSHQIPAAPVQSAPHSLCPHCRQPIAAGDVFCGSCGQRITPAAPPVQPQPQPQPVQPQPQPVQSQPVYRAAEKPADPQPVSKELEQKIQAYKDLLNCGILSQAEYEQAIRDLKNS